MTPNFPTELEQEFNEQGFNFVKGDTKIRSEIEVGPPKQRNRYTKSFDQITANILICMDNYNVFKSFYETTLDNGTLPFTYFNPLEQAVNTFRFVGSYQIQPLGGRYFTLSFSWEILPQ